MQETSNFLSSFCPYQASVRQSVCFPLLKDLLLLNPLDDCDTPPLFGLLRSSPRERFCLASFFFPSFTKLNPFCGPFRRVSSFPKLPLRLNPSLFFCAILLLFSFCVRDLESKTGKQPCSLFSFASRREDFGLVRAAGGVASFLLFRYSSTVALLQGKGCSFSAYPSPQIFMANTLTTQFSSCSA